MILDAFKNIPVLQLIRANDISGVGSWISGILGGKGILRPLSGRIHSAGNPCGCEYYL